MRPPLFLAFVFLLISCTLLPFSVSGKCNPHDKQALLRLKKDLGNPEVLSSWDPKADCCDNWYGANCDESNKTTHRINSVSLGDGLSGPIPASIGNLPFLETLSFRDQPNLTGPIPPTIAKLKHLSFLDLSNNNLSGPVPEFLGQLKNLTLINLSSNKLTGSIPSSLSLLSKLFHLNLDKNKLTGPIPETFGEFKTSYFTLSLAHNRLSGQIPVSLGKVDFNTFDFSWNKLQGEVSELFLALNKSQNIWSINLSGNLFKFNLSNTVLPVNLHSAFFKHNKITGGIPESWTKAVYLARLNVSYNNLCGQIPVGGSLQYLNYTSYIHNKCLCGSPLPSCK